MKTHLYAYAIAFITFFTSSDVVCSSLIHIPNKQLMLDEQPTIYLSELNSFEVIELQAKTMDGNGVIWKSFALFQADDVGEIDITKQAPIYGNYDGVDPSGLIWSMQPDEQHPGALFEVEKEGFKVSITALRGKEEIASDIIMHKLKDPNVQQIDVTEDGLVGTLFVPESDQILPVVITINGSDGGFGKKRAQLLASHGFATFALAYFGEPGLPSRLKSIPLEYFETAFNWLAKQEGIDSNRMGIYGTSRGAELSIILGSLFPDAMKAIVAVAPSSVIHRGLSRVPLHAWKYKGKPLVPFAPISRIYQNFWMGQSFENPVTLRQNFLDGMVDAEAIAKSSIPVENIKVPLLLVSGGDDMVWPASIYANQILERLKEKKSPIFCEHLYYPSAGHTINLPNIPQSSSTYYNPKSRLWFAMGGSPKEYQNASYDSWKKIIAFFQKELIPKQ